MSTLDHLSRFNVETGLSSSFVSRSGMSSTTTTTRNLGMLSRSFVFNFQKGLWRDRFSFSFSLSITRQQQSSLASFPPAEAGSRQKRAHISPRNIRVNKFGKMVKISRADKSNNNNNHFHTHAQMRAWWKEQREDFFLTRGEMKKKKRIRAE